MKKKIISLLIANTVLVTILTGCGDLRVRDEFILAKAGQENASGTEAPEVTNTPEVTESPEMTEEPVEAELSEVQKLELKYASGEFQAGDLRSLGELYLEQGQIKKGRDMLETALLLYGEEETRASLSDVTVNVAEESEAVQDKMKQLSTNFELPELEDEVVGMILADDWYDIMLPGVMLVERNYYLQQGDSLYYVKVGKNDAGKLYTTINRIMGAAVTVIHMENNTIQRVDAQLKNGAYDGAFESWLVDKNTSDIIHETGNFAEGKYTGEYTIEVRWGSDPGDFFTLWTSRKNVKVTSYNGAFDENGMTTIDQKDADKVKHTAGEGGDNPIIYAKTSDGGRCLFVSGPEGQTAETMVFDVTTFGMPEIPSFETYEPIVEEEPMAGILQQNRTLESDRIKVRVFDGQIQIFDGTSWYNMGSVETYVEQDPMTSLKDEAIQKAIEKAEQQEEEELSSISVRSAGSTAVATPKPTKKPTTVTPVTTKAPTPAPTKAPAQQPSQNNNPQPTQAPQPTPAPTAAPTAQPTPAPTTAPTPAPTAAPTQAPSNDTDAEFTPDMM